MKKIAQTILGTVALAALTSSFAANLSCPTASQIRELTNFSYAYQGDEGHWTVFSKLFAVDDTTWGLELFIRYPYEDPNPSYVVTYAKSFFANTPLLVQPTPHVDNGQVICRYSPDGAKYNIIALSPPDYGFKRIV